MNNNLMNDNEKLLKINNENINIIYAYNLYIV